MSLYKVSWVNSIKERSSVLVRAKDITQAVMYASVKLPEYAAFISVAKLREDGTFTPEDSDKTGRKNFLEAFELKIENRNNTVIKVRVKAESVHAAHREVMEYYGTPITFLSCNRISEKEFDETECSEDRENG